MKDTLTTYCVYTAAGEHVRVLLDGEEAEWNEGEVDKEACPRRRMADIHCSMVTFEATWVARAFVSMSGRLLTWGVRWNGP